jgi:hypothetical protein
MEHTHFLLLHLGWTSPRNFKPRIQLSLPVYIKHRWSFGNGTADCTRAEVSRSKNFMIPICADNFYSEMLGNGYNAYNVGIMEEVLVMTPVLLFLGDSPMHAEVTNTPVPSAALNPCCFCILSAPTLAEKVTMKYLQEFLQISSHGTQVCTSIFFLKRNHQLTTTI